MYILDTDHLTALQRGGAHAQRLLPRLDEVPPEEIAVTIVSVDEQLRGWLEEIHRARNPQQMIAPYKRLHDLILFFSAWSVVPFDEAAKDELVRLQKMRLRSIGPYDSRIAAICLANDATLLSSNLVDFSRIPDLTVEDWLA